MASTDCALSESVNGAHGKLQKQKVGEKNILPLRNRVLSEKERKREKMPTLPALTSSCWVETLHRPCLECKTTTQIGENLVGRDQACGVLY